MLTWSEIQNLHVPDLTAHWQRTSEAALECPLDVFEQLFFDHQGDVDFAGVLRLIDWHGVRWDEADLSGVALRRVSVPRRYRHAVDEARARTAEEGVEDERPDVMEHWQNAGTWMRAPVLVAGEVIATSLDAQCLVGFTRLGNLFGLLDRQEFADAARHRVWLGRRK